MSQAITVAFAGDGEVDPENVKALLNDYLGFGREDADGYPEAPEHDIVVYIPLSKDLLSPAVETVLEWTEYADLPFTAVLGKENSKRAERLAKDAEATIEASNVPKKLIDLLSQADGQKALILAWGEDGGDQGELLLDLADSAGIKVLNLCEGLDDIVFAEDEPEAVPEPEPEPAPARRGRRSRATAELDDTPDELTDDEPASVATKAKAEAAEFAVKVDAAKERANAKLRSKDGLQEQVQQAAPKNLKAEATIEEIDWATQRVLDVQAKLEAARVELDHASRYLVWLKEARLGTSTEVAESGAESHAEATTEAPVGDSPKRGRGRPRNDGRPVQPRTGEEPSAYLENEDGTYTKRGRGRVPAGSKVVMLTPSEVKELGSLVDD